MPTKLKSCQPLHASSEVTNLETSEHKNSNRHTHLHFGLTGGCKLMLMAHTILLGLSPPDPAVCPVKCDVATIRLTFEPKHGAMLSYMLPKNL